MGLGLPSVAGVSVLVVASTDGSKWIAFLSNLLTSLVVLGWYGLCSYLGTPLGVTVCDPWHGFPNVLYRLWPIGVATRHLEVLSRRGRTQVAWLWPYERKG